MGSKIRVDLVEMRADMPFLAHWTRTSEILHWDKNSYLSHVIQAVMFK